MLTHRFPLGLGSIGQKSIFQHGHVAYQIKGNAKCSNLQANILSLHRLFHVLVLANNK